MDAPSAAAGTAPNVGPVLNRIQRAKGKNKSWTYFGHPVKDTASNGGAEPMPKKAKIEQNTCDDGVDDVLANVAARIEVLEKQWLKHFGDLPTEETQNNVSEDTSEPEPNLSGHASVTPSRGKDCNSSIAQESTSQNRPSEYKCPMCTELFSSIPDLKTHAASSHGHNKGVFPCEACGEVFFKGRERRRHFRRTHRPKCSVCSRTFKHQKGVEEHLRVIHGVKGETTCSECGEHFASRDDYITHLLDHEKTSGKKLLFACTLCISKCYFLSDALRLNHEVKDHNKVCVHCGSKFVTVHLLKVHHRIKHKKMQAPQKPYGQGYRA